MLQKVVEEMFGWCMFDVDLMNSNQIGALAGGFYLRLELMSQTNQFKRRNKSSESLIKVFWPERKSISNRSGDSQGNLSLAIQIMANLAKLT